MPLTDDTLLVIEGIIPRYSARGLEQDLRPDPNSQRLERSIDGGIIDFSLPQMQKYISSIRARDARVPSLDNVWPGLQLTVDCVCQLSYDEGTGEPGRAVVPGSSYTEEGTVFYRPRLTMVVSSFRINFDEWNDRAGWEMELIEV